MKVSNKKKFIVRVIETIVIISTIIFTILAIKYATAVRGYEAVGGEYLLPILALIIILIIETIYEESEEKRKNNAKEKKMEEDKLHKSYIWHIVTLAKMKYKLKKLGGNNNG